MNLLAIETSCDETAAAVLSGPSTVLANRVASQADIHRLYGGVVPELASRCHIETIEGIVRAALDDAALPLEAMDAFAVTRGPGLIGSLLVGLSFAKSVAYVTRKPIVGVNHLEGHIRAAFIESSDIPLPAVALVVSGGHTALYWMAEAGQYRLLAKTRDDAAGEAYDKVAKMLGLGYPGGPIIDRIAPTGDEARVAFPMPKMSDGSLDFSFSGLKTAALRWAQAQGLARDWARHTGGIGEPLDAQTVGVGIDLSPTAAVHEYSPAPAATGVGASTLSRSGKPPGDGLSQDARDLCASFQRAAVALLVERTLRAAQGERPAGGERTSPGDPAAVRGRAAGSEPLAAGERAASVILSGGVACNSRLRAQLGAACTEQGFGFFMPSPRYCTDNAAMIGAAAWIHLERGERHGLSLNADPVLRLGGPEARRTSTRHR